MSVQVIDYQKYNDLLELVYELALQDSYIRYFEDEFRHQISLLKDDDMIREEKLKTALNWKFNTLIEQNLISFSLRYKTPHEPKDTNYLTSIQHTNKISLKDALGITGLIKYNIDDNIFNLSFLGKIEKLLMGEIIYDTCRLDR